MKYYTEGMKFEKQLGLQVSSFSDIMSPSGPPDGLITPWNKLTDLICPVLVTG
jgi:hypothetical protein